MPEKNKVGIQNLQACVHKSMGGNLHFPFCGNVVPVSYKNYKCCNNVFAIALFQVAFHSFLLYTVHIIIKCPPNARMHGYGYGRPTNARTGVHRCTNGHPRQTGMGVRQVLKRASNGTNTERAKWWHIPT